MTDQLKQLSEAATLINRLRGIYAIGPDVDGKPEFGYRDFGSAFTPRIQLEAADRIEDLEAQLTEAQAREAVAYEVAADAVRKECTPPEGTYDMRTERDIAQAEVGTIELACDAIRALTPDHTTTALEQIKQEARDEGIKEVAAYIRQGLSGWVDNMRWAVADLAEEIEALATLSEPEANQ